MQFSSYERSFVNVNEVLSSAAVHTDKVVELIQQAEDGITCKELGEAIFGHQRYNEVRGGIGHSCQAQMGHILSNLRQAGFIVADKVPHGDPIQYTDSVWVAEEIPKKIRVHDDAGNEYIITNPRYSGHAGWNGHYETITKTIQPTVNVWHWNS